MKWINHLLRFSTSLTMRFTPGIKSGVSVTRSKLCLHKHPVDSVHCVMLCQRNCNSFNKMYYYYQPSHADYVITVSHRSFIDSAGWLITYHSHGVTPMVRSSCWFGRETDLSYLTQCHIDGQTILRLRHGDSSLITHTVSQWWSAHLTDLAGWLITHISHSLTPMVRPSHWFGRVSHLSSLTQCHTDGHLTYLAGCLIPHHSHTNGQFISLIWQGVSSLITHTQMVSLSHWFSRMTHLITHTGSHRWPSHWFGRVSHLSYLT